MACEKNFILVFGMTNLAATKIRWFGREWQDIPGWKHNVCILLLCLENDLHGRILVHLPVVKDRCSLVHWGYLTSLGLTVFIV